MADLDLIVIGAGMAGMNAAARASAAAIFTDPEFCTVGLTEAQAREAGHDVGVGTATFSGAKARAWSQERAS